jgi:hypothetical protein
MRTCGNPGGGNHTSTARLVFRALDTYHPALNKSRLIVSAKPLLWAYTTSLANIYYSVLAPDGGGGFGGCTNLPSAFTFSSGSSSFPHLAQGGPILQCASLWTI